ncbi:uncharacterized protein LOC129542115 [Moschus berezovskii]|uniref:uncharacterized protein LOC129542115 n=1 Tax=Moschus berezovskii TaxID=68408 RepID=UPI0024446DBB|nr:uncharacterized protein LOC129542115 [Moschus berezovskii]
MRQCTICVRFWLLCCCWAGALEHTWGGAGRGWRGQPHSGAREQGPHLCLVPGRRQKACGIGTGAPPPPCHPEPWSAHHPPPACLPRPAPETAPPRAALGLTWTCSSVKMVCSCLCGMGLLVMTDISRICLKTCLGQERWQVTFDRLRSHTRPLLLDVLPPLELPLRIAVDTAARQGCTGATDRGVRGLLPGSLLLTGRCSPAFRQKICTWLPKSGTFISVPSFQEAKGLAMSVNE